MALREDTTGIGFAAPVQHGLNPLLAPRSIALVGASTRVDTAGNDMVLEILESGFNGSIYLVNPRYSEVEGFHCYNSLSQVPGTIDLVVIAVGNTGIEEVMAEAIDLKVAAAVIFGSAKLADESHQPFLSDRLRERAQAAGMPVCGTNCLGFYNLDQQLRIFPQHLARELQPGGITFISQSGSILTSLLWNNQKLKFNLAISAGAELVTDVAHYMDYALEQPTTRVITLFLETVRRPDAFIDALQKALQRGIPVVVLKAGRTEAAAELAVSHSGAIAGNDAAYQALFDRYGVIRVHSLDELAATAQLLAMPRRAGPGGIAAILDSGGERELLVDLADAADVPFANISPQTSERLALELEPGLEPINPLDAWGTGNNHQEIFENCWQALMDDADTAIGVFVADLTSRFWLHESFARVCRRVAMRTDKPVVMMTNHLGTESQDLASRLCRAGIQVLDGTEPGLAAIRHAFAYRDFVNSWQLPDTTTGYPSKRDWRERLGSGQHMSEHEGLQLLLDYGVPAQQSREARTREEIERAAGQIGFPLVLKTAVPGIAHKSDVGGVRLGLTDMPALLMAYAELETNLGPEVVLSGMVEGTAEVAFGMVNDPQWGPVVMVASGGIFIELMGDRQVALAPVTLTQAEKMLEKLIIMPILRGTRGQPATDIGALSQALVNFSQMAYELRDYIEEIDVNPIKAGPDGCTAVDALVVTRQENAAD